jgi:hypothetical protein
MVDEFVVFDVQYTRRGWINRNRYLYKGEAKIFSIELEKGSDFADIKDRKVSEFFDKRKFLDKIKDAYRLAPFFSPTYELLENIVFYEERNLFYYILNSIEQVAKQLSIKSKLSISTSIDIDHSLKSGKKIIAICKEINAAGYINPIGGKELYNKNDFAEHGIKLNFLNANEIIYTQNGYEFVPYLSILDILMFNDIEKAKEFLNCYTLE